MGRQGRSILMENEVDRDDAFTNLVEIIIARKSLVVLGFLSVFSVAIIITLLLPSTYEATTRLFINKPLTLQKGIPMVSDFTSSSFVGNQKEIIKSRFIYEKVVRKLKLHKMTKTPNILSKIKDFIKENLLVGFYQTRSNPLEEAIDSLRENTEVRSKRGINIVEITARSSSSKQAADIANTLAQTYIEYAYDFLSGTTQKAYDFNLDQVEAARLKLDQSEKALEEFKEREGPISLQEEIRQANRDMLLYKTQLRQLNLVIKEKENQGLPKEMRNIKTRLDDLRAELNIALTTYMDDHPNVIRLRNKIASLERILSSGASLNETKTEAEGSQLTHLKKNRARLLKKIQQLNAKINELSRKKSESSKKEFELLRLTMNFENNIKIYANLLEKLQNVRILKTNEMKKIMTIKVLDPAFPPPYSLKKKKALFLAISGIMGIIFGFAMAFIAEYADDSLKTTKEVEAFLNLPVLATISPVTKKMLKSP
jgi:uncharacterized protein involved in exopolysaccharide biosynthesis